MCGAAVSAELEQEASKTDAILVDLLLGNENFHGMYSATEEEVCPQAYPGPAHQSHVWAKMVVVVVCMCCLEPGHIVAQVHFFDPYVQHDPHVCWTWEGRKLMHVCTPNISLLRICIPSLTLLVDLCARPP